MPSASGRWSGCSEFDVILYGTKCGQTRFSALGSIPSTDLYGTNLSQSHKRRRQEPCPAVVASGRHFPPGPGRAESGGPPFFIHCRPTPCPAPRPDSPGSRLCGVTLRWPAVPDPVADPVTGAAQAHAAPLREWLRRRGAARPSWCRPARPRGRGRRRRLRPVGRLGAGRARRRHPLRGRRAPGGHAHTVDIELDGVRHGVDTGFLVYNERTYPFLIQLFRAALASPPRRATAVFSVQVPGIDLEWAATRWPRSCAKAQPRCARLLGHADRPAALQPRRTQLALSGDEARLAQPIGDFLREQTLARPSVTGTCPWWPASGPAPRCRCWPSQCAR